MKQINNSNWIFTVDEHNFKELVIEKSYEVPILVDFWADWCAPCIILTPILENLVEEYQGKWLLAKCEVDEGENMRLAGHYKLRGFPTILLFNQGENIAHFTSAKPAFWIKNFIKKHLEV
jgi:putative thioredoxin